MIFVYPHTCFSLNPWNLLSFCHFFVLLYAGYYKYTLHSKRLIVQTIRRKKIYMKDFRRTKSESEREEVTWRDETKPVTESWQMPCVMIAKLHEAHSLFLRFWGMRVRKCHAAHCLPITYCLFCSYIFNN